MLPFYRPLSEDTHVTNSNSKAKCAPLLHLRGVRHDVFLPLTRNMEGAQCIHVIPVEFSLCKAHFLNSLRTAIYARTKIRLRHGVPMTTCQHHTSRLR